MRSNSDTFAESLNIHVNCFYEKGDIDSQQVFWLVQQLKVLFNFDHIYVVTQTKNGQVATNFRDVDDLMLKQVCSTKEIVLSDKTRRVFNCVLQTSQSITSISSHHNQITLVIDDVSVLDIAFQEKILDFVKVMAQKFVSDFCFACDLSASDYRYGINRAGLSLGLRDIYWMNIFGAPFIKLIGEEKLLSLSSATKIEKLAPSLIFVCLERPNDNQIQQELVKNEIGSEYFVKSQSRPKGAVSSSWLPGLIRHFWRLGHEKKNQETAEQLPAFTDSP